MHSDRSIASSIMDKKSSSPTGWTFENLMISGFALQMNETYYLQFQFGVSPTEMIKKMYTFETCVIPSGGSCFNAGLVFNMHTLNIRN